MAMTGIILMLILSTVNLARCDYVDGPNYPPTETPYTQPTKGPYESSPQDPYQQPTQVPYEPTTQRPYEPTTQDPYQPPTQGPYEPTTQRPYEATTQRPYEPTTQRPYRPYTIPPTHDCLTNHYKSCLNRPDGDYPACYPLCQDGHFISCSNGRPHVKECAKGYYGPPGYFFTDKMVYDPPRRRCERSSRYCPRWLDSQIYS